MGAKQAPAAPDYSKAADTAQSTAQHAVDLQTQANRPNQSTQFASSGWTKDANGNWTQSTSLNGGLGTAATSLENQAAQNSANPINYGSFGSVGTGDSARDQAISGAYNQAASRLNPQWQQSNEQLGSQLANQGLDPNSQAYRTAMQQQGMNQNDAYSSAMNGAIAQGTAAQQATFGENLSARQQQISEAQAQQAAPYMQLAQLYGFGGMPNFNAAGNAGGAAALEAALAKGNYGLAQTQMDNQIAGDEINGGAQVTSSLIGGGGNNNNGGNGSGNKTGPSGGTIGGNGYPYQI